MLGLPWVRLCRRCPHGRTIASATSVPPLREARSLVESIDAALDQNRGECHARCDIVNVVNQLSWNVVAVTSDLDLVRRFLVIELVVLCGK